MNIVYPSESRPLDSAGSDPFIRVCVVDGNSFRRTRLIETLRGQPDFVIDHFDHPGAIIQRLTAEQKFVCLIRQPKHFSEHVHEYASVRSCFSQASLLLLHDSSPSVLAKSILAGFRGYYSEALESGNLVRAIRVVNSGAIWVSGGTDRALDSLAKSYATALNESKRSKQSDCTLSNREKIVLSHIAAGLSNRQIAAVLRVSTATVKANLRSVFHKLNVRDRTTAALRARERGIISPEM